MRKNLVYVFVMILVFFDGARGSNTQTTCAVSPTVHATAPSDPGVDPLSGDWYMNADRSVWAMHYDRWRAGIGSKVPWIRPAGVRLVLTGRRLDGPAPPLWAQIPGVYDSAFQATGMKFPVAGCWQVTGRAGNKKLSYVLQVEP
jgi:hypothetical protein